MAPTTEFVFSYDDGWIPWDLRRPVLKDIPVQIMREAWARPELVVPSDMYPDENVVGLYWRPTGIYKARLASLPLQVRAQMESVNSPENNAAWDSLGARASVGGGLSGHKGGSMGYR